MSDASILNDTKVLCKSSRWNLNINDVFVALVEGWIFPKLDNKNLAVLLFLRRSFEMKQNKNKYSLLCCDLRSQIPINQLVDYENIYIYTCTFTRTCTCIIMLLTSRCMNHIFPAGV